EAGPEPRTQVRCGTGVHCTLWGDTHLALSGLVGLGSRSSNSWHQDMTTSAAGGGQYQGRSLCQCQCDFSLGARVGLVTLYYLYAGHAADLYLSLLLFALSLNTKSDVYLFCIIILAALEVGKSGSNFWREWGEERRNPRRVSLQVNVREIGKSSVVNSFFPSQFTFPKSAEFYAESSLGVGVDSVQLKTSDCPIKLRTLSGVGGLG
ncbi:hypothetical protein RRG08_011966, partial [Elysia crispata]